MAGEVALEFRAYVVFPLTGVRFPRMLIIGNLTLEQGLKWGVPIVGPNQNRFTLCNFEKYSFNIHA